MSDAKERSALRRQLLAYLGIVGFLWFVMGCLSCSGVSLLGWIAWTSPQPPVQQPASPDDAPAAQVPQPLPKHKRLHAPQDNPGYGRGSGPQPWPSAEDSQPSR